MKNFVRLLKFAWPYKIRFGLSIVCAGMVALLFFAELGMVYPLLHILFDSQNPQRWVAEQIDQGATDIQILEARKKEVAVAVELVKLANADYKPLGRRFDEIVKELGQREQVYRDLQKRVGLVQTNGPLRLKAIDEAKELETLGIEVRVLEARKKELEACHDLIHAGDNGPDPIGSAGVRLTRRIESLNRDVVNREWWRQKYIKAQPFVQRYLPHEGFTTLLLLIGLVMVGMAVKGLFVFFQETLVADVMQLTLFSIRNRFFRRTMNLDLASFSDQGSSELMARFTNDMDSFGQGLNTVMSKLIREPMRIVVCLSGALMYNWRLTLLTLILVPISAATTVRVGKIMKRAVRRSLESMSTIYKILQESFQGIKVVKAFATERVERRRFFIETKNLYKKSVRVAKIDAMSDPVLEMMTMTTVSIALLAGSYLVLYKTIFLDLGFFRLQLASHVMEIQDLLALYTMLAGVSDPIRKLANVHSKIQRASAAADRICALMDRRPSVVDTKQAKRLMRHRKTIELDEVCFSYNAGSPVIKELTLSVRHGESIALVGPNGCGKSTLMNLLPRFWDVDSGAIRIDGHDIREIQVRSLRQQIGIVLQENTLFQDTVANNIAYGSPHATRAQIIEAAEHSYAHSFIQNLPQGYDTLIGERGYGLSGGQRQRIALARAMLRDPAILILDEATSAVDIQDEVLIRKAIEEFSRGRTTFFISHNLASIQFAHRIVLINSGRVEAVGTDAELKRSSSLYRRLHEIHYHRETA